MQSILLIFAVLGLGLFVLGRILIVNEARGISTLWVLALRFLPLSDLMFLARYWDIAKQGAFTSLIGLGLMMPLGGKLLWDAKHPDHDLKGRKLRGFAAVQAEEKRRLEAGFMSRQIQEKQARLTALESRLQSWHGQIQQKRAVLGADPEAIAAFNIEAAAYHEFLHLTKEEAAAVELLRTKVPN